MSVKSRALASLLVSALIVSPLAAAPTPAAPTAAAQMGEASPQAAVDGFVAAINTLDAVRISRLLTDGITAFFPGPPFPVLRVQGKTEVTRYFAGLFEALRARGVRQANLAPAELLFQTWGDTSIATFQINGAEEIGRRTLVLRRIGGRWLISHYHASASRPPAPAAPAPQPAR